MLKLKIKGTESYDEESGMFVYEDPFDLELEHSLVSLSKWESLFKKPFLGREAKTSEETIAYIMCMILDDKVDPLIVNKLEQGHINVIKEYIEDSKTATTIKKDGGSGGSRAIVTSELIYSWMVAYRIPFECQHWHLSRLLMLINVIDVQNKPQKKMSRNELLSRNKALNEQRRRALNSKG